jgi:hypothetical protein
MIEFENPTQVVDDDFVPFTNGQVLPVYGGPLDGASLPVPVMFGEIFPTFARYGRHIYQLLIFESRWRFAF